MARERIPKKGVVYVLKNKNHYKFGCTTNLKSRLRSINFKQEEKYTVLFSKNSKDIFASENFFKYFIWENHLSLIGNGSHELFDLNDGLIKEETIEHWLTSCCNLRKVGGKYEMV